MKLQLVGCSHHTSAIEVRERLAFSSDEVCTALDRIRNRYPDSEAVLLSTCNRVELYTAGESSDLIPSSDEAVRFLAEFHGLQPDTIHADLFRMSDEEVLRHLFRVSASLDSMVVGEPQILSQVKQAYQHATAQDSTGPITHSIFQAAVTVARRVANETTINQRRVSIPSLAVADFAKQIFEQFDDKHILLIGAGEMAEETLLFLKDEGATNVTVINRNPQRATELATKWGGRARPWEDLAPALVEADLVISTTGAGEPVVTLDLYKREIEPDRNQQSLFVLDLAVPRDVEPAVGDRLGVYLYSIDDLRAACERNRLARDAEMPAAIKIVDEETDRFMAELRHRATGPIIQRLRSGWTKPKEEELERLFNKLPDLDDRSREEVRRSFDRMINKLLHPPLESLRDEARQGSPQGLLDALKRLFQLRD